MTSRTENIYNLIKQERERQDEKWGEQNHDPLLWLSILGEEFGEIAKELNEHGFDPYSDHLNKACDEIVQLCAVGVAMLECMDRNGAVSLKDVTTLPELEIGIMRAVGDMFVSGSTNTYNLYLTDVSMAEEIAGKDSMVGKVVIDKFDGTATFEPTKTGEELLTKYVLLASPPRNDDGSKFTFVIQLNSEGEYIVSARVLPHNGRL